MKKVALIGFVTLFLGGIAFAQDAPQAAQNAFSKKYSGVEPYSWDVAEKFAIAYFDKDETYQYARFSSTGTFEDGGTEIYEEDVPAAVLAAFKKANPNQEILSYFKAKNASGQEAFFFVGEDMEFKYFFLISPQGKPIKTDKVKNEFASDDSDDGDF